LERTLRAKNIRTVVNLRGNSDPFSWYLQESRVTHRRNVCQEDICFSAGHLPSVSEVRRLVAVLERTEYPILLHCRRGADRTGMTAAIVLLLQTPATLRQARFQLGLRYGHVALGRPANLDRFLDLYDEWLQSEGLAHSPAAFRHWLLDCYCPAECRCALRLLSPRRTPIRVPLARPFGVRVRCTNTSIRPWRLDPGTSAGVHVKWTLSHAEGYCTGHGRAGLFRATVPPGGSVDVTLALPALILPGGYELQVDMADEQHGTFLQMGSAPLFVDLEVR
jgi:hypothetical protein